MLVNSSLSDSSVPAHLSNSSYSVFTYCLISRPSSLIFITIDINIIFLMLPLCVFILHHGATKWLKRAPPSSSAAVSHSDCFTYHMVTMEVIGIFGYILNLIGICNNNVKLIFVGGFFTSTTWFGENFFHTLTCVDLYLAVVHPVIYISLKNKRGIRIRNIIVGSIWPLSFVGMSLMMMTKFFFIVDLSLLTLSSMVILFCSISVLCVLVRPGPGEQGKGRERVNMLRQRAFYSTGGILVVLVVRFTFNVVWEVIFMTGRRSACVVMAVCVWSNVPSCLVLPLLYLHRAGTFVGCKNRIKTGNEQDLQGEMTTETKQ